MVIVSIDPRNASDRVDSVLAVPFGSAGAEGPTSVRIDPGETGLPEPSYLKAHFISVVQKSQLIERLPRALTGRRMREVVAMINRAIDPDAEWEG